MAHNVQSNKKSLLCLHGLPRQKYRPARFRGVTTGIFNGVYRPKNRTTMTLNETSQKGLKDGWTRATFILRKDYLEKLKSLSYWQRKKLKEVVNEALGSYLEGKRIRKKMSR